LLTASITIGTAEKPDMIEFDGGAVKVSARTGRLTFYGLESKSGKGSAINSLKRRIDRLGIEATLVPLKTPSGHSWAYAEIAL
jgi:hypothetical protein